MGIPVLIAPAAGRQRPGRWTDLLQAEVQVFCVQIHSPHRRHAAVCSIGPEQNRVWTFQRSSAAVTTSAAAL